MRQASAVFVPCLGHRTGARQVAVGHDLRGRAPGDGFARQQQRLRKMFAHLGVVVQHGNHGAPLGMPLADQASKRRGGLAVYRVKGFVQQDQAGVLHQQTGKQHALELPAGKRADGPRLKTFQADSAQGRADGGPAAHH
jgi:hypothetical protein